MKAIRYSRFGGPEVLGLTARLKPDHRRSSLASDGREPRPVAARPRLSRPCQATRRLLPTRVGKLCKMAWMTSTCNSMHERSESHLLTRMAQVVRALVPLDWHQASR